MAGQSRAGYGRDDQGALAAEIAETVWSIADAHDCAASAGRAMARIAPAADALALVFEKEGEE